MKEGSETFRGKKGDVAIEAEVKVLWSQAKGCGKVLEAGEDKKWNLLCSVQKESSSADIFFFLSFYLFFCRRESERESICRGSSRQREEEKQAPH